MRRLVAVVGLCGLLAAGCTQSEGPEVVPATEPASSPITVAVLGGSEADGQDLPDPLRTLWSREVFDALPPSTVYVNLGAAGATAAEAAAVQVPEAVEIDPDVALVWLEEGDAEVATPAEDQQADLVAVIEGLGPGTEVLVLDGGGPSAPVAAAAEAGGATLVELGSLDPADVDDQPEIAAQVLEALDALGVGG